MDKIETIVDEVKIGEWYKCEDISAVMFILVKYIELGRIIGEGFISFKHRDLAKKRNYWNITSSSTYLKLNEKEIKFWKAKLL